MFLVKNYIFIIKNNVLNIIFGHMLTNDKIQQIVKEVLIESIAKLNESQDNTNYTHLADGIMLMKTHRI